MKITESFADRLVTLAVALAVTVTATSLQAQTQQGKAEVRAIKGSATYSIAGMAPMPLKVGAVLPPGSTVQTGSGSVVDLFLGNSAGVVRVAENTTLGLDKLTITDTGADTVIENQLNLKDGTMLFNVNKLSAASKYEIKLPNGVAGIRGTRGRCNSNAYIVLLDGTLVFVHAPPGGPLTPYTLVAPPPVYFSPIEGVKRAPEDLIKEVTQQIQTAGGGQVGPPPANPSFQEPFVSPGVGDKPPTN